MKTERNILIAFILNFAFSIFEFIGGFFTGSVAIVSDAVHDIGDAASIGVSYFLEKKSKKKPDEHYTYGYTRYSVIGSVITTLILLVGSVLVVYNAILRIINPTPINYDGMIIFAIVGAAVNFLAAFFTREGDSLHFVRIAHSSRNDRSCHTERVKRVECIPLREEIRSISFALLTPVGMTRGEIRSTRSLSFPWSE